MASKTISVDLEAYERLRRARQTPGEPFSRVIKRAQWSATGKTCADVLRCVEATPLPDRAALDRLNKAQRADKPPVDRWQKR